MKTYNWAILGCGRIARKFASDLKLLPNAKLYATASRSLDSAAKLASEFGFERHYGSYEEMVNDPNVDIVYIATPHSHHCEHTLLCLEHKKAVLCEKAFAINSHEVALMIDAAKNNNTFLMEAFWTRFLPSFKKAMEIINSKELGKLRIFRADFSFNPGYEPENRWFNTGLGGGSLLDIGIYPVFMALMALGNNPCEIKTLARFCDTGAEESITISLAYPDGQMASLTSSLTSHSTTQAEFCCENGYVRLNRRFFLPTTISMFKSGEEEKEIEVETSEGFGYKYEAEHVMDCLDNGLIESKLMTWQNSIDLMSLLDLIRKDAGIVFPDHDTLGTKKV